MMRVSVVRVIVLAGFGMAFLISNVQSFDNNLKGFVMGFGAG
jgi:hypothetical protein